MDNGFALALVDIQKKQTIEELRESNEFSGKYGLCLTEQQIMELTERRFSALKATGRIEFGPGILKKLLQAFSDSPFIVQTNFEEMILELQDSFYYFKNESMDRIPDDELIAYMKKQFDGVCQGSLEYLNGKSLEELCHGTKEDPKDDSKDEETDTF